jgi:hypothetical protein
MKTAAQIKTATALEIALLEIPVEHRAKTLLTMLKASLTDAECEWLGNEIGRLPQMRARGL